MPSILAWTAEEDALLRALIQEHGTKKWALISSLIQTKSSKQCRRRWKNNVDMEAKATTWTPSEDAQLVKFHRELGNKWTQISKRFGDRTDNAVKNRWHALCKKQPELAEEESPVTTVGVRRGTRTRQHEEEEDEDYGHDFSTDYSEESGRARGRAKKKIRRGAAGGGGAGQGTRSGGTSRGTSLTDPSSGRQPSRLGPYGVGSGSGLTVGGQTDSGIALLPTPFDRVISRRGAGGEIPPVSIVVPPGTLTQQELLMAQQLNAKGTPFQIEVAEIPREGSFALNAMLSSGVDWIPDSLRLSDGSGSGQMGPPPGRGGGRAVIQGALPGGAMGNLSSGAVGGFGGTLASNNNTSAAPILTTANTATAAMNINSSLSINDLLNWLNSTTVDLPLIGPEGQGVAGGSNTNNSNGKTRQNRRGMPGVNTNNNNNMAAGGGSDGKSSAAAARRSSRALNESGSLHASLSSGSSRLSSGQRDLLTRLFSQVRDSAELQQQQWQQQLGSLVSGGGGSNAAAGGIGAVPGNEALMMFLDQQNGGSAGLGNTASDFHRMLSLGLGNQRSLSLGFGQAAAAAGGMGSLPLAGSLNPFGSLQSNPSGKTRSSSGRGTSAFTEAADAAIAAVDSETRNKEAAMAAAAMAQALVRQHSSGRSMRRGSGGSGGLGSLGASGSGGSGGPRARLSDVPVIAPQYSAQDIDTLIGALAVPKAR